MSLSETPWVDRTLKSTWDRIAAQVPEGWMPELMPGRRFAIQELGCGHYGCVAPTVNPDFVFKLTSDVTEARFVVMASALEPTGGIVKYHKIFALRESEYRRRPLFVLWRQSAKYIGVLMDVKLWGHTTRATYAKEIHSYDEYQIRNIKEGLKYLDQFLKWAREVREKVAFALKRNPSREEVFTAIWEAFESTDNEADPRDYKYHKTIPRIGLGLSKCYELAMLLQNTDVVYPIGAALGYYLDEGILLADVHLNNIGLNVNNELIITDPGHAVEFHPKWTELPKVPII